MDEAVAEILRVKTEAALKLRELGLLIRELQQKQLWILRQRRTAYGEMKSRWSSFEPFCKAELGLVNVWALRDLSLSFTQEELRRLGTTKCSLRFEFGEDPAILRQRVTEDANTLHKAMPELKLTSCADDTPGHRREDVGSL